MPSPDSCPFCGAAFSRCNQDRRGVTRCALTGVDVETTEPPPVLPGSTQYLWRWARSRHHYGHVPVLSPVMRRDLARLEHVTAEGLATLEERACYQDLRARLEYRASREIPTEPAQSGPVPSL